MGSRWYTTDLDLLEIDASAFVVLWHQGLYPDPEEMSKSLWPGCNSKVYVGACCKPLAIQVLHKWYKDLENTGPVTDNRSVSGAVVRRLGTILPKVPILWSEISVSLDPLRSTWLRNYLQQKPTWSSPSFPDYSRLTLFSSTRVCNLRWHETGAKMSMITT
jgi:hypothetical protein